MIDYLSKTEEGRRKVEALLNDFERIQEAIPYNSFKVDVDGLRQKLGLPLRKK